MTIGKTNKRTAADGLSFAKKPPATLSPTLILCLSKALKAICTFKNPLRLCRGDTKFAALKAQFFCRFLLFPARLLTSVPSFPIA